MRNVKSQNGFTLIGVMVVLTILSVLGLSLATLALGSVKVSSGEREEQSAYYIAEAGLTYEMAHIEEIVEDLYDPKDDEAAFFNRITTNILMQTPKPSSIKFEDTFGETPEAKIEIMELNENNPRDYEITATGSIGSKQRTVSRKFSITWSSEPYEYVPEYALLVNEKITLENGTITGNIATRKDGANSVMITGNPTIEGDIIVPKGSAHHALSKPDWKEVGQPIGKDIGDIPGPPPFPDINALSFKKLPDQKVIKNKSEQAYVIKDNKLLINNHLTNGYTLNMDNMEKDENLRFDEILLTSDYELNINVGSEDKGIIVNHLNIENGHINIVGSGNLNIYIENKFTIGSGSKINDNKGPEKLSLFLKKTKEPQTLIIGGSQKIVASLYAENANVNLGAGGGFKGNIFTGGQSFKVSGGSWSNTPFIYAPNAEFIMSGRAELKGAVIANSFKITGGAKLKYNFDEEDGGNKIYIDPDSDELSFDRPDRHGKVSIDKGAIREN